MADIFISYSRRDRTAAQQLAEALTQLGFDVWWDFDLLAGDHYRREIRTVIDHCKVAIVLWSTRSAESDFVLDEAAYAKGQSKLRPVRIDRANLPFGFGQLQTDDLIHWNGDQAHAGFENLVRSLEGDIGRKAKPRTPSPAPKAKRPRLLTGLLAATTVLAPTQLCISQGPTLTVRAASALHVAASEPQQIWKRPTPSLG